jgi:hypothetical protein
LGGVEATISIVLPLLSHAFANIAKGLFGRSKVKAFPIVEILRPSGEKLLFQGFAEKGGIEFLPGRAKNGDPSIPDFLLNKGGKGGKGIGIPKKGPARRNSPPSLNGSIGPAILLSHIHRSNPKNLLS